MQGFFSWFIGFTSVLGDLLYFLDQLRTSLIVRNEFERCEIKGADLGGLGEPKTIIPLRPNDNEKGPPSRDGKVYQPNDGAITYHTGHDGEHSATPIVGPIRSQRPSKLPAKLNEFVLDIKVKHGSNRKPIGCKQVFRIKYKSNGEIERYKARLVAKGFSQKEGIAYEETFSLVVKMSTVRCLINIAVQKNWKHMHAPLKSHFDIALRVLKYLKLAPGLGVEISKQKSKRQATLSNSSVEAEYRSMASTTCEILWIVKVLGDFGLNDLVLVNLYCDKKSAIHIAANPIMHEKTKHFDIDVHLYGKKLLVDRSGSKETASMGPLSIVPVHKGMLKEREQKQGKSKVQDELIQGELVQGELLQGELIQGELVQGELLQGELIQGELVQGELIQGELVQGELLQGELIQGELVQGELI
ncbi:ribonuclease H-like domain-containing protein [Tanacetum coccineum]